MVEPRQVAEKVIPLVIDGNVNGIVSCLLEHYPMRGHEEFGDRTFDRQGIEALSMAVKEAAHRSWDNTEQLERILDVAIMATDHISAEYSVVNRTTAHMHSEVANLALVLGHRFSSDAEKQLKFYTLAQSNAETTWRLSKQIQNPDLGRLSHFARQAIEASRCLVGVISDHQQKARLLDVAWYVYTGINHAVARWGFPEWKDVPLDQIVQNPQEDPFGAPVARCEYELLPEWAKEKLPRYHGEVADHIQSYLSIHKEGLNLIRARRENGNLTFEEAYKKRFGLQKDMMQYLAFNVYAAPAWLFLETSASFEQPVSFLDYFDRARLFNTRVFLCIAKLHNGQRRLDAIAKVSVEILDSIANLSRQSGDIAWATYAYQLASDYWRAELCDHGGNVKDQWDQRHLQRVEIECQRARLQATIDIPSALWRFATAEAIARRFLEHQNPGSSGLAHRLLILMAITRARIAYESEMRAECQAQLALAEEHFSEASGDLWSLKQEWQKLKGRLNKSFRQ